LTHNVEGRVPDALDWFCSFCDYRANPENRTAKVSKMMKPMDAKQARAELEGGIIGVVVGLAGVSDMLILKLHEVVPERGSDLWVRFTRWRDSEPDRGGDQPFQKWVVKTLMGAVTVNLQATQTRLNEMQIQNKPVQSKLN
jgi:hypothetical protein